MKRIAGILAVLLLMILGAVPAHALDAKYTVKFRLIKEQSKEYLIRMRLPEITGLPDRAIQTRFNRTVIKRLNEVKDQFLIDITSGRPMGKPWPLELDCSVKYSDDRLLSLLFNGSSFIGGAHPNPIVFSLLFDLEKGEETALGGLFRAGSGYLGALSDYCSAMLEKRLGKDALFPEGMTPRDENFRVFYLGPRALTVVFPPAQSACYAEGIQEVPVPPSILRDILDPGGPAAFLRR
jgi:hypothetical protein